MMRIYLTAVISAATGRSCHSASNHTKAYITRKRSLCVGLDVDRLTPHLAIGKFFFNFFHCFASNWHLFENIFYRLKHETRWCSKSLQKEDLIQREKEDGTYDKMMAKTEQKNARHKERVELLLTNPSLLKAYPCDECNFKATQKGHLLTHKKSVYEGVKFPCDQCFYKATRKNHLLTHPSDGKRPSMTFLDLP